MLRFESVEPGEDARINTETLPWHLDAYDARLVRDLFLKPATAPLAMLLTVLRADSRGLGRFREEARRRQGDDPPADRYALSRFSAWFPAPRQAVGSPVIAMVTLAVFMVIGAALQGCDIMTRSDWPIPWLQDRYVRLWIIRHRDRPSDRLIAILIAAIETAGGAGLVLPEPLPAGEPPIPVTA